MLENIVDFINKFFLYYILVYSLIFFISTIVAMLDMNNFMLRKKYKNDLKIKNLDNYMPISIIVPAYNEETTIIDCIKSILDVDYKTFEVIVVNDGSSDDTEKKIIEFFKLKKTAKPIRRILKSKTEIGIYEGGENIKITLINKENGGKADALNMGINASRFPFVACIDADSMLDRNSLRNIVFPFIEDDTTIAVGGNIKVSNDLNKKNTSFLKSIFSNKLIVIFQRLEYYRVFITTRVWMNKFNGNLIISGAFGLFNKKALINVGGYNSSSIGEDMELVVKMHSFYRKHKIKYKIAYEPTAICWSQAPEKIMDLKSQRKRWQMGLMESLLEHKYIFLNPQYGVVGIFSFLYFFIFELYSCVIEVFGVVFIGISYVFGYINLEFFITFLAVYIFYSSVISAASVILEGYIFSEFITLKDKITLILFSFIEPFGYRQVCSLFRLLGILNFKKRKDAWQKILRKKIEYKI